jgi:hypothetical protein
MSYINNSAEPEQCIFVKALEVLSVSGLAKEFACVKSLDEEKWKS